MPAFVVAPLRSFPQNPALPAGRTCRTPPPLCTSRRRISIVCAASAPSQNTPQTDILKDKLFSSLKGIDRGLALDADADDLTPNEAEVETAIEQLEDLSTVPVPTRDSRLFGHWRLIYTSSSITRYFGGVTALQRLLPDGEVGRITQSIDEELGTATLRERLFFDLPFRSNRAVVDATVSGKFRPTSEVRLVWTPEKVRVGWFSWFAETWKTLRAFQVADITFLDDDLRITRGQNGSAFVYERVSSADGDHDGDDDNEQ